jgi:two-component system, cell cycle response regulator CtrA
MRVLLIHDDHADAHCIAAMLKSEAINVYTTDIGEEGIELAKMYDFDILLLDLNLPDISGFEVIRALRLSKVRTPILILTNLADLQHKVSALRFGADDYLTVPFHRDELIARIRAIVRRSKGHAQSVINFGDLRINLEGKTVEIGNAPIHLTPREYQIVELLGLRKGRPLNKEAFLNNLYGEMDEPHAKIIDVFVSRVRKKLTDASKGKNYIETVRGHGYIMREPNEPDRLSA